MRDKRVLSFFLVYIFLHSVRSAHLLGSGGSGGSGTFKNPSARTRPRFRYWVPDASVDLATVRRDVAEAGRVGAGGIELLGYYNYGDIELGTGIVPTDWTKYGWGTPAWRKLQEAAIQAAKDHGQIIDLALGPNQGAGVPSEVNANGLQWDLRPFNVTVPPGSHFNNTLPGWGSGPLISASTGLVISTKNKSSAIIHTLAAESLNDLTTSVSADGKLAVSFPTVPTGQYYVVFAYYLVHTQYREQQTPELVISGKNVHQSPVTSYVQNGSWVVDHFSKEGANAIASFWMENLLNGGTSTELLKEVGNYIWEDSQEFPSNIFWTPSVPRAFQNRNGYAIHKYLPVLLNGNGGGLCYAGCANTKPVFVTDEPDHGASHVDDFRQTMTGLNQDYLKGLHEFAKSIGVQLSSQPGYNWPIDMLSVIPNVAVPETETLGFNHNIDAYRQFSGAAGLAGKKVISSEAGAVMGSVFQQTVPDLLWDLKRSVVGGVNAFVIHGFPFSGLYPNTTWPTYTTFDYLFSEMHNRHQPGWDYYRDFIDYTARVQHVMQTGVAKIDLAFWQKRLDYVSVTTNYEPTDLENAGFTYEYLSPNDFSLPNAFVTDSVLAPRQQEFKALIIRGNDTLTVSGVQKLSQWAQEGLPVVFSGGIPSNFSGTVSAETRQMTNVTLTKILKLQNVYSVPFHNLAQSILNIGIRPRSAISVSLPSKAIWYTKWRESANESVIFVYYDATGLPRKFLTSNATVRFASTGIPYIYDAWTGEQTALEDFNQDHNSTTVNLSLAGNQSTIIAFRKRTTARNYTTRNSPSAQFFLKPIVLRSWDLSIESWTAPADLFDIEGTVKRNTTYFIKSLKPWNQLDVPANLTYISGKGYYHSTFAWPLAGRKADGVRITMAPFLHTAILFINGHKTAPLDVTAPRINISRYLKAGTNSVDIVVSTPLGNALIPLKEKLRTMGTTPYGSFSLASYGLVGEVLVEPYICRAQ